ncbi:Mic19 protein [Saccharomycopsis crataegensis]|uniref:Mic19 protein n=1 Tax=Saccharomycopsis crataegensis TaxID=43959 RepID=A0AAV5QDT9_9ASCO|nr:Mic19 protein [Saccharomycopsis crataegensis]
MGSSASKPEQTKVFTPATPVEFSQEFLNQLDNSEESNYARSQLSEKFIQKEVSKKLADLQKETNESLSKTLSSKLELTDSTPEISSSKLDAKIEELTQKLNTINSNKFFQDRISKEANTTVSSSREEVLKCLKDNSDKPLNCWDEVQKFRGLVKKL